MAVGLRDIEGILIPPDKRAEFRTEQGQPLESLRGLSGINVFVGANSSGKSRLMRRLTSIPEWQVSYQDQLTEDKLREELSDALRELNLKLTNQNIVRWGNTTTELIREPPLHTWQSLKVDPFTEIRTFSKTLSEPNETGQFAHNGKPAQLREQHPQQLAIANTRQCAATAVAGLVSCLPEEKISAQPKRVYVPVLRGLRAIGNDPTHPSYEDLYEERTRKDYELLADQTLVVATGATLYQTIRKMLLGTREERLKVRGFEEFLQHTFFDGREVTLTPNDERKVLHILVGDDEYPIHHVGDGLQTIIILTFDSFIRSSEPCVFYIEEPELFLHPGLERRLIEFFNNQKNHMFFLTTHSNHLLDMTLDYDISVFNFRPASAGSDSCFQVESVNRGDRSSLELLGVRNSSVFLVNATVWVEGVTERHYLREFLRLYQESLDDSAPGLSEDVHYSFVEYGGSNITHWSFLEDEEAPIQVQRLCGRAFLLADNDGVEPNGTDKKADRLRHFRETLGERYATTPGREIENLLPWCVIRAVVQSYEGDGLSLPEPSRAKYRDAKLGDFLNELLGAGKQRKASYAAASGTVNDKSTFCRKACEALREQSWDDLDPEVQQLVRTMHAFVCNQNGLSPVASR